jgi:L-2-hydroxyglutarate oxidase LhgO
VSGRVGIVGGGIIGLAVARELLRVRPTWTVKVLEKEAALGQHQTGHNSGVVHAGLYYAPESLKATLCRRGVGLLKDFCAQHELTYDECGKLVVALDEDEAVRLRAICDRATANQVPGLRLLEPEAMAEIEPHINGRLAVHSPTTAIVDFGAVARAMTDEITDAGATVHCGFLVRSIREATDVVVRSAEDDLHFDHVVLCAGLQSDRVAKLVGAGGDPQIVPFRGEFYRLLDDRSHLVRGLVYPVPDPRLPFLGIHFTRRVNGAVDVGPNAVLALAREGYRRRDVSLEDIANMVRWPGFWRAAHKYWRTGVSEMIGSLSKQVFVRRARAYLPELAMRDVIPAPAGVRAQAIDRQGALLDDFSVTRHGSVIAVRNAPSPAATSSLAIAEHICARLLARN